MTVLDDIILGVREDLNSRKALAPNLDEAIAQTPKPIDALTKFIPGPLHVIKVICFEASFLIVISPARFL